MSAAKSEIKYLVTVMHNSTDAESLYQIAKRLRELGQEDWAQFAERKAWAIDRAVVTK